MIEILLYTYIFMQFFLYNIYLTFYKFTNFIFTETYF